MKNLLKRFKNKKGFTLIELIITAAILVIVSGMVLGILSPIFFRYETTTDYIEAKNMAKNIIGYVKKLSQTSTEAKLTNFDDAQFTNAIFIKDDLLYRREGSVVTKIYEEEYFEGWDVELKFLRAERKEAILPDVLQLQVEVRKQGDTKLIIKHTEAFEMVNLNLKGRDISIEKKLNDPSLKIEYLLFELPEK